MKKISLFFAVAILGFSMTACDGKKLLEGGLTGAENTGPTFSKTSITFEDTVAGETRSETIKLNNTEASTYTLDYSEDLKGVFTVAFKTGCELSADKKKLTVQPDGCDVELTFSPIAAGTYSGTLKVGTRTLTLKGTGKDKGITPTVTDIGIVGYTVMGGFILPSYYSEKAYVTVTNNGSVAGGVPISLVTAPADFKVLVSGISDVETGFTADSCFDSADEKILKTDDPISTKSLEVGKNCKLILVVMPNLVDGTDIKDVVYGEKTFSIKVDNGDPVSTTHAYKFNAQYFGEYTKDGIVAVHTFDNTVIEQKSKAVFMTRQGFSPEILKLIKEEKLTREVTMTFKAGFFDNFVIDKDLTTCGFVNTDYTQTVPQDTASCYIFFRFAPRTAEAFTYDFVTTVKDNVLVEFISGDKTFQVGETTAENTDRLVGTGIVR